MDERGPYAPPPLAPGEHRAKTPLCGHRWLNATCSRGAEHRCDAYRNHAMVEHRSSKCGHTTHE